LYRIFYTNRKARANLKGMRILVTGASGLIGKNFIRHSLRLGHDVRALVRSPQNFKMLPEKNIFKWSHENHPPEEAFEFVDAIVHLAGESIAGKSWSNQQKKIIVESRLLGTRNLVEVLSRLPLNKRPKVLLSGSAVGYYGYQREEVLDESASAGQDFLAKLCVDWEQEALKAKKLGLRVVLARTGLVLSKEGGALAEMPPVQISNGKNWMSWIHIEDMVRIIDFAIENENISEAINCVAPKPVQNKDFVKILAHVRRIPFVGRVPRVFLDIALGEMAQVVVSSLRVKAKALETAGFKFLHPDLSLALEHELRGCGPLDSVLFKDQFVPLKPEEVFPFFSRAENLETLTPPWLNFKIVAKSKEQIKKGSLIDYKLNIHGVPVRWRTLISAWKKNELFIDEQLKGPYTKWHHVHTFDTVLGGCLLRDEITYRAPGFIFGKLLLSKWISSDVNKIFSYRQEQIQKLLLSGQLKSHD